MYTTLDKAIVAFVVALLGVVGAVFHKQINIDPSTIASLVAMATPVLVYFWPNAPKDS